MSVLSTACKNKMLWLIRRMCYDDAILFMNQHSVEYLYLDAGLPQYRVYHADDLIGVVRVRHPARLPLLQPAFADYLLAACCDPYTAGFRQGYARTPPDAKVRDLPVLKLDACADTRPMLQMPSAKRAKMRVG